MSFPPGLNKSSSPLESGNGSAGSGGSPKREGGNAAKYSEKSLCLTWIN